LQRDDSNLFTHFERQWRERKDEPLLSTGENRSFSWRDLDVESARMADSLRAVGVVVGDRVSVQAEKSPASLCLYLACLRAGFVYHPLNPAYQRTELEFLLGDAEPAAVVCDPGRESLVAPLARRCGARVVFTDDSASLTTGSDLSAAAFGAVQRDARDPAALLYSSGTTGRPKGIVLTHGNLLANASTLVEAWGFTPRDRLLHALPIFHVHGLFVALGCALLGGATMRWLPTFRAAEVIRFLPECSVFMGVPTYYTRLLAEPGFTREIAAKLRLFVSGSAPLLPETFAAFEERTGQRILERYGMTETNMNTSNPLQGPRKPGTVGPPLPGVELRIVDETGRALPAGEVGQIQVRGPNVFSGYWKQPERTGGDFTADGFFATGDLARVDADGYVTIVGRAKDVIISGGLNVYPKEVEEFIDGLPGVSESAVIGVPHPDFGEGVVAVIVAARGAGAPAHAGDAAAAAAGSHAGPPTEREIIDACRRELAAFKVPKRVVQVAELPRNSMGKVQKNLLRSAHGGLFK
jgi:malonyl-CoA/methylmalonyl-CoA synthetase